MTYEGYDVLDLRIDGGAPDVERIDRRFTVLDAGTGYHTVVELSAAPSPERPFSVTALTPAQITQLRTFLETRRGRAVPFWLPSYLPELTLAEDVGATDETILVRWAGYTQFLFGMTGARRHIALWRHGSYTVECHAIENAAEGDTVDEPETLTISPAAGGAFDRLKTGMSFLRLCRLEDDQVAVSYPAPWLAQATIRAREIPMEAPA